MDTLCNEWVKLGGGSKEEGEEGGGKKKKKNFQFLFLNKFRGQQNNIWLELEDIDREKDTSHVWPPT